MIVTLAIWVACIPAILALSMTVGWLLVVIRGGIFGCSKWSNGRYELEAALCGHRGYAAMKKAAYSLWAHR